MMTECMKSKHVPIRSLNFNLHVADKPYTSSQVVHWLINMNLVCGLVYRQDRVVFVVPKKVQLVTLGRTQLMKKSVAASVVLQLQQLSTLSTMPLFKGFKVLLEIQKICSAVEPSGGANGKSPELKGSEVSSVGTFVEKSVETTTFLDGSPQAKPVDLRVQRLLVGNCRMFVALKPSQLLEPELDLCGDQV